MATYHGEKYIKEQIESILASTYPNFKIKIYDDGSKDGTIEILREYEKQYPNIIVLHQNGHNQGVTRNFLNGVCHSESDYIMFCDQDDVWLPEKLSLTYEKMKVLEEQYGKEKPLLVFTDAVVVDTQLKTIHESFFASGHLNPHNHRLNDLLMENKLIGCTVMLNGGVAKLLKTYPLPNKARLHDWWVGLIGESMGAIGFVSQGTLLYRQHGNNVVGNQSFMAYLMNRMGSLKKQREMLIKSEQQAFEFLQIYGEVLSIESYKVIEEFSQLRKYNWWKRRVIIVRRGFWKTGLIRNIGLMIIV